MIHKDLENWSKLNFVSKMANMGSEAIRVLSWGRSKNGEDSLTRFLQLMELTIKQEKRDARKNELKILKKYFIQSGKTNRNPSNKLEIILSILHCLPESLRNKLRINTLSCIWRLKSDHRFVIIFLWLLIVDDVRTCFATLST